MSDTISNPEIARALWRSRRGLLELDMFLMPFARHSYPTLPAADRLLYQQLLDLEDTELLSWLSGRSQPSPPELAALIAQIIDYAKSYSTKP